MTERFVFEGGPMDGLHMFFDSFDAPPVWNIAVPVDDHAPVNSVLTDVPRKSYVTYHLESKEVWQRFPYPQVRQIYFYKFQE